MKKLLMIFTILSVFCAENVVSIEPAGKPTGKPTGKPEETAQTNTALFKANVAKTAELQNKSKVMSDAAKDNLKTTQALTAKLNEENQNIGKGFSWFPSPEPVKQPGEIVNQPAYVNNKTGNITLKDPSLIENANDLNENSQEFNEGAKALKEQTAAQNKSIRDMLRSAFQTSTAPEITPEAAELASKLKGKNATDMTQGVIDSTGQQVDPATKKALQEQVETEMKSNETDERTIIQKILDFLSKLFGRETSGQKTTREAQEKETAQQQAAAKKAAAEKAAAEKAQNSADIKAATQYNNDLAAYKKSLNPFAKAPVETPEIQHGNQLIAKTLADTAATQKKIQEDQNNLWN